MTTPTERDLFPMAATIDEEINKAAKFLPQGYFINIRIEKEGYGVSLQKPDYSEVNNVDGGDGIRSDINAAICIANGIQP